MLILYTLLWLLTGFILTSIALYITDKTYTIRDLVLSCLNCVSGPIAIVLFIFLLSNKYFDKRIL